jgi:hypothetical protein
MYGAPDLTVPRWGGDEQHRLCHCVILPQHRAFSSVSAIAMVLPQRVHNRDILLHCSRAFSLHLLQRSHRCLPIWLGCRVQRPWVWQPRGLDLLRWTPVPMPYGATMLMAMFLHSP